LAEVKELRWAVVVTAAKVVEHQHDDAMATTEVSGV
jgi:hypothetical protein